MEKETGELTTLAMVLLILAIVMSMAMAAFYTGKKLANGGQTNFINSADSINDSEYDEFNMKEITGLKLKSELDKWYAKGNVVLISTNALNRSINDGRKIQGKTLINANSLEGLLVDIGGTEYYCLNFGKILAESDQMKVDNEVIDASDCKTITFDPQLAKFKLETELTNETSIRKAELTSYGSTEIKDGARFQSYIIEGTDGVTCGVCLIQIDDTV